MSTTITITKTLYAYAELTGTAKESARMWYINSIDADDIASPEIEHFLEVAEILGVDVSRRLVSLAGGRHRSEPKIFWSGFAHQGSGASFCGEYRYRKGAAAKLRELHPEDEELHAIAAALQAIQRRYLYRLVADISLSGRDTHSSAMRITVQHGDDPYRDVDASWEDMRSGLRRFADWLYARLQEEWESMTCEEAVDDALADSELLFDRAGTVHIA